MPNISIPHQAALLFLVLQSMLKLTLEKERKGEIEEKTEKFGERTLKVGRKADTISFCMLGN